MNAFAPIFYVAFFKGRCVCLSGDHFPSLLTSIRLCSFSHDSVLSSHRFAGRPGDYVYVFGDYRMEEVGIVTHTRGYLMCPTCTDNVHLFFFL